MYKLLLVLVLPLLLASCATTANFDTSQVDRKITPASAIEKPQLSTGKKVIWGGTILDTQNLKNKTQIEVLAYPLNASHRPLQENKPLGRFIIHQTGYLEANNYAPGRQLSVLGNIIHFQKGKVGESSYSYPLIQAEQLYLWPPLSKKSKTSFHFGIGIGL